MPEVRISLICNVARPELVMVTVWGGLTVSTGCAEKVMVAGAILSVGADTAWAEG
jgi:hypothetical protein